MDRRTLIGFGIAAGLLGAGALATWRAFERDLARARARIAEGSLTAESRFGPVEYAIAGAGPRVLLIHGAGGGFDQGLAIDAPLIARGYEVLAPSRFGYLRSSFPSDPSPENQADAFVDLLDALGIGRLPVIGVSAGALSAQAFALRHPGRCAALVALVPASYVPYAGPPAPSPVAAAIMEHGLQSDFLFWLGAVTAPDVMTASLLATDPDLVAEAGPEEQARVRDILWSILPVSARAEGLRNEARQAAALAPLPLERIAAPTLAISFEDDRFGTYAAAQHIAANVPGARFVGYPTGGHVFVGHVEDVFGEVDAFLRER